MIRRDFLALAAAALAPSDTINLGVIGTGGRARRLMQAVSDIPGTRIIALCDVWDVALGEAKKYAQPNPFTTKHHDELLARKDIDAVIIAAPDHQHVPLTIDAIAAGKDVYVEKPLTHEPSEGPKIIAANERYKRVVQVGTQHRSMTHLIKAREIVKSGKLGEIHKVHMTWNRNAARATANAGRIDPVQVEWSRFLGGARQQPFEPYRFRNWRWFWDFGGGIFTDLMVHWLDTVNWMLDLELPTSAASIGDQIHAKGLWETPDTVQTLLHYPSRSLQLYFEGTFVNQRNAAMTEIMGRDATLYIDRGRYELIPEPGSKLQSDEMILGEGRRGADFYANPDGELLHIRNWLDCIRSRKEPNAPIVEGVKAAAGAHLANAPLRH